jgi:hypothetical protein
VMVYMPAKMLLGVGAVPVPFVVLRATASSSLTHPVYHSGAPYYWLASAWECAT